MGRPRRVAPPSPIEPVNCQTALLIKVDIINISLTIIDLGRARRPLATCSGGPRCCRLARARARQQHAIIVAIYKRH